MPSAWSVIGATVIAAALCACGEPYREEAAQYVAAVHEVLIEKGVCPSVADCRRKQVVFWNDAVYPWDLFSRGVTYVNLYETQDPVLVDAVVVKLTKLRAQLKPGVTLTVFKSKHGAGQISFRRITIR
jgi:hypothetical protein